MTDTHSKIGNNPHYETHDGVILVELSHKIKRSFGHLH